MALHTIELFAGVGMLGEGVRAGLRYLGVDTRCVCYVEREAYAGAVLAAHSEGGGLDPTPVWSDVCTFDARAWRGAVDCVVAGFPCQDLSVAGRRAGLDGKRSGLFFEVLRIADDCGAWLVVLENVAGIASATATVVDEAEGELEERAAARVLGELADRGWNAEWLTLSASDVGASHGRARWFCLAWRGMGDARLQHEHLQQWPHGTEYSGTGCAVADAGRMQCSTGYEQSGPCSAEASRHQSDHRTADGGADVADPERSRGERWRKPGNMACTSTETEVETQERERCRPTPNCRVGAMADACSPRWQGCELGNALHADRGGAGSTWTN